MKKICLHAHLRLKQVIFYLTLHCISNLIKVKKDLTRDFCSSPERCFIGHRVTDDKSILLYIKFIILQIIFNSNFD